MFPKLETQSLLNKEKIAANIIQEDHIKDMLSKTRNSSYKPWKSIYCPKNSHSPFGNYPKSYFGEKIISKKPRPIFEKAQASMGPGFIDDLGSNKFSTGVRNSSMGIRGMRHQPPPPYCGARAKRRIPNTHFRK